MASSRALTTLGSVILVTLGGIAYIHHSQTVERQNLRRGVPAAYRRASPPRDPAGSQGQPNVSEGHWPTSIPCGHIRVIMHLQGAASFLEIPSAGTKA
ncbi:hypothetical protein WJX84_006616 [Apatococcus fuscideae]|uniref:Uncharacterized protein n=1 Tax=Apatococcus fuscideae TaxID=2026836 RepID=A0AAW1TCK2_9CHLO